MQTIKRLNIKIKSATLAAYSMLVAVLTLVPTRASADTVDNCGDFLPSDLCTDEPMQLIGMIANYMVGLFGALFVLMIVVSGAQMASAGDSPDRLKAAKSRLINAVVALVLLISFRAILYIFGIEV